MKKKYILPLLLSFILLIPGCSLFNKKITGVYEFEKIKIDDNGKTLRCNTQEQKEDYYCSHDTIKFYKYKFEIVDESSLIITAYDEGYGNIEYEYELTDDGIFLIEGLSSEEEPNLIMKNNKIIMKMPEDSFCEYDDNPNDNIGYPCTHISSYSIYFSK